MLLLHLAASVRIRDKNRNMQNLALLLRGAVKIKILEQLLKPQLKYRFLNCKLDGSMRLQLRNCLGAFAKFRTTSTSLIQPQLQWLHEWHEKMLRDGCRRLRLRNTDWERKSVFCLEAVMKYYITISTNKAAVTKALVYKYFQGTAPGGFGSAIQKKGVFVSELSRDLELSPPHW